MPHLQIRNVPPELHRKLKARAAEAGMTLSEYMIRKLERAVEFPTIEELTQRIRSRDLPRLKTPPEGLIRADRESH